MGRSPALSLLNCCQRVLPNSCLGKFFDLLSCKLKNCWDIFCPGSVEFSWVTGERNFVRLLIESHFFRRKIKTLGEKKKKRTTLSSDSSFISGFVQSPETSCWAASGEGECIFWVPVLPTHALLCGSGGRRRAMPRHCLGLQHRGEPAPSCTASSHSSRSCSHLIPVPWSSGAAQPSPRAWFWQAVPRPAAVCSSSLPRLPLRGRGRAACQE